MEDKVRRWLKVYFLKNNLHAFKSVTNKTLLIRMRTELLALLLAASASA